MPQDFLRLVRFGAALGGMVVLAACGGGGGGGVGGGGVADCDGDGVSITVSGRITFDRLEFNTTANTGLNAANPVESPARDVAVEAVGCGSTLATTTTDSAGNYSFSVPANSTISIRARAQMVKTGAAPTWNFTVRNNTNSDAVYALQGDNFGTGTANVTRNLRATSGWGGSSYTGTRAAAPFAILDTVYRAKQMILAAAPTAAFSDLNLYWSATNRPASPVCPDLGNISTSFYTSGGGNDDCSNPTPLPQGIYILGDYANGNGDTDEFDAHVIAHEFGHYFEDNFSRSDSIGGQHGEDDRLDLRVAFGEGWGNGFAAMTQNDPVYRDSAAGISSNFAIDLESGVAGVEGWFSEASVGEFLWDVFDSNTPLEAGDNVALGFAPIFAVMTGPQVNTEALTSIYSFASALRSANTGAPPSAIGDLLHAQDIRGTGAFGTGETNDGGDPSFVEVYRDITVGGTVTDICSTSNASGNVDGNKHGNRQFLRFVKATTGLVTIRADGFPAGLVPGSAAAVDPDILVNRRGVLLSFGPNGDLGQSGADGEEIMQVQLEAGTYVLEVYAYEVIRPDPEVRISTPRCMSLSISGTN
jgi:hypothetical protein